MGYVMVNQMRRFLIRMLSHAHAHESITVSVSGQGNETGEFLYFVLLSSFNTQLFVLSLFIIFSAHHLFNNNFIQNFYYFNFMFTTLSLILNSYLWVKYMYASQQG